MKNLIVVTTRFPFPLDKGDKLRLFHQIKYLSNEFHIHLLCVSAEFVFNNQIEELMPFCKSIQVFPIRKYELLNNSFRGIFSNIPFQVNLFFSKRIEKKIESRIQEIDQPIFYFQLSRTALYAKKYYQKSLLDLQDAFSINYQRTAEQTTGFKKFFYKLESKRMKKYENNLLQKFKLLSIISSFDKKHVCEDCNNLSVISNGVDEKYYAPQKVEKKYDILFSGNLNYLPNEKAALFLIEKIFPKLILQIPDIKIAIAGDTKNPKLKSHSNPQIIFLGKIDDMRKAYASSKIYVAPLFTGAGLQNKLLETMSMEIPCITTSIANVSLIAENKISILIAENTDEFVEKIIALKNNEELYEQISFGGKNHIHKNFLWITANKKLAHLINSL